MAEPSKHPLFKIYLMWVGALNCFEIGWNIQKKSLSTISLIWGVPNFSKSLNWLKFPKNHFSQFTLCGRTKFFEILKLAETSRKPLFIIYLMWGYQIFWNLNIGWNMQKTTFHNLPYVGVWKFFEILKLAETFKKPLFTIDPM